MRKIQEHTILFTEACPLDCRYCYLKDSKSFGNKDIPKEQILQRVEELAKKAEQTDVRQQLLLTGGEPFIQWDLIKEIFLKYGNVFSYKFNTSGVLLDEEKIRFLSKYQVSFVLSIDGDTRLTNYLRPNKMDSERVGYFNIVRKIFPILLYYFPKTPYRIIISPRYIDQLYPMYLYAEQLGFRYFSFILDFESRPDAPVKKQMTPTWNDNYTEELNEQIKLIVNEMLMGFKYGIKKPEVVEINQVLEFLARNKDGEFSIEKYPCQVFSGTGRTLLSVSTPTPNYCMSKIFPDIQDAKIAIEKEYKEINHRCPRNPECLAFEYCCNNSCPKNNYDQFKSFFTIETLDCALKRVTFEGALQILFFYKDYFKESKIFGDFLRERGFGRRIKNGN